MRSRYAKIRGALRRLPYMTFTLKDEGKKRGKLTSKSPVHNRCPSKRPTNSNELDYTVGKFGTEKEIREQKSQNFS